MEIILKVTFRQKRHFLSVFIVRKIINIFKKYITLQISKLYLSNVEKDLFNKHYLTYKQISLKEKPCNYYAILFYSLIQSLGHDPINALKIYR